MTSKLHTKLWLCAVLIVAPLSFAQARDSGLYLGASAGTGTIEILVDDSSPDGAVFDEDDTAWKAILGYNFGITPVFNLGIEGGYVDFGAPSADVGGVNFEVAPTGWNLFGVIGVDVGPVGFFGKLGYLYWDADAAIDDITGSFDGSDLAYGLGIRVNVSMVEIRAEYELYDIEDAEDLTMASLGLVFHF